MANRNFIYIILYAVVLVIFILLLTLPLSFINNIKNIIYAIILMIIIPMGLYFYINIAELLSPKLSNKNKRNLMPWFWLAPALMLLIVFLIYPVINTFILSLFNANSTKFVGLDNYKFILRDQKMLISLRNNLLWVIFFTFITVTMGIILAVASNEVKYEVVVKTIIFLPSAISFVAAGVIWKFMYAFNPAGEEQIGTLNAILMFFIKNFQPQAWLFNPYFNNWVLIIVGIWIWTGYAMIILSAGLKGIPISILEAARIDGANNFAILIKIILPMLTNTITVVTTTLIITVLKIFDIVYIMTNGNLDTEVIANRMYKEMFSARNYGRASAIAIFLLLAIIPVMIINIRRFVERRN